MEYKKINMPGLLHGGDYNPEQWLDRPDILVGIFRARRRKISV